tara:strand:- start:38808 stop:39464 length:657 start_codon:yes stop_codon:yes gene_type:complete
VTTPADAVAQPRPAVNDSDSDEPLVATLVELAVPWTQTLDYANLTSQDEPRDRIAAAARSAENNLSGEDFLAIVDAVSPIGVSISKLTGAIVPIFDKLGFHTSHQSQGMFQAEPGRVLLATLCTLASRSLTIKDVHQGDNACSIVADIPLGIITNPGQVVVALELSGTAVIVSLSTRINGQWHDWGKSKRMIDDIYAAIQFDLTRQQQGTMAPFRRVA